MTVEESVRLLNRSGAELSLAGDRIRVTLPKNAPSTVDAALNVIREHKAEAIDLLSRDQWAEPLEAILKGHVVELWSDAAHERLFIVADEEDAAKLGEPRGTVYTADELRRVVQIGDPAIVLEIHEWKRRFDARLREYREREGGA